MANKRKSERQKSLDRKAQEVFTNPDLQLVNYEKGIEHADQVNDLGEYPHGDPDRQPFNIHFHYRHRKP